MIYGVGTDLCSIARLERLVTRNGASLAQRILATSEMAEFERAHEPARFLAKRFAAKEALGKALGTGVRAPVLLRSIAVTHDERGKPAFVFDELLMQWLDQRGLQPHLSLSDEVAYALAFVVVEHMETFA